MKASLEKEKKLSFAKGNLLESKVLEKLAAIRFVIGSTKSERSFYLARNEKRISRRYIVREGEGEHVHA